MRRRDVDSRRVWICAFGCVVTTAGRRVAARLSRDSTRRPVRPLTVPVATTAQARFGAKSGKAVKARRAVVVAAVTEPETTEKLKRKFVKKNITVKPEEVVIGAFTGKVVRHSVTSPHSAMPPRPHRKRPASAPSRAFPTATTPAFFATSPS